MSVVITPRSTGRHVAVLATASALVLLALLAIAGRAQAAETLYWDNFSANPDSISFANIDGNGGGALNLGAIELENPEGMALDPATSRLFVANAGKNQIDFVNLDGSGAGVFNAPGAPVAEPEGIAVDAVARTIYWSNAETKTIAWARLDGSAGGVLNTTGATIENIFRLAVDPIGGRVYWGSNVNTLGVPSTIGYANVNNTGGGELNIAGATPPDEVSGLAVDPAAGRLYWVDANLEIVSFASLSGAGGEDVDTTGASFERPWGLAFDPVLGKLYWGNEGNGEERTDAIGVGLLAGGGGITLATAPVNGPQDPLVLKSPTGTAAPQLTRSAKVPSELSCTTGSWAVDYAGSFVYQAPSTFRYQWTNNGAAVAGATAKTLRATAPGNYACVVTAVNQAGSAAQTSAATVVSASSLKLTVKKKAKVKPGRVATFNVQALNQGEVEATSAKVCTKVPKKAKKFLKAPKCKLLTPVAAGGTATAKLKIKVKRSAHRATYKVTFQVTGSGGQAAKAKVLVTKPKGKKKK
jgi:DNA-binding beta-propeller fold protein YncE